MGTLARVGTTVGAAPRPLAARRAGGGRGELLGLARARADRPACGRQASKRRDRGRRRHLLREAHLLARVGRRWGPALVDVGPDFLVAEWVEGVPVGDRLRGATSAQRDLLAGVIAHAVGRALEELHEAGVHHGDVKPANVLCVRPSDASYSAPTRDAAEEQRRDPRRSADMQGRRVWRARVDARYAAPELRERAEGGPAADLWALGVLLAELLDPEIALASDPRVAVRAWDRGAAGEPGRWVDALLAVAPGGRPSAAWIAAPRGATTWAAARRGRDRPGADRSGPAELSRRARAGRGRRRGGGVLRWRSGAHLDRGGGREGRLAGPLCLPRGIAAPRRTPRRDATISLARVAGRPSGRRVAAGRTTSATNGPARRAPRRALAWRTRAGLVDRRRPARTGRGARVRGAVRRGAGARLEAGQGARATGPESGSDRLRGGRRSRRTRHRHACGRARVRARSRRRNRARVGGAHGGRRRRGGRPSRRDLAPARGRRRGEARRAARAIAGDEGAYRWRGQATLARLAWDALDLDEAERLLEGARGPAAAEVRALVAWRRGAHEAGLRDLEQALAQALDGEAQSRLEAVRGMLELARGSLAPAPLRRLRSRPSSWRREPAPSSTRRRAPDEARRTEPRISGDVARALSSSTRAALLWERLGRPERAARAWLARAGRASDAFGAASTQPTKRPGRGASPRPRNRTTIVPWRTRCGRRWRCAVPGDARGARMGARGIRAAGEASGTEDRVVKRGSETILVWAPETVGRSTPPLSPRGDASASATSMSPHAGSGGAHGPRATLRRPPGRRGGADGAGARRAPDARRPRGAPLGVRPGARCAEAVRLARRDAGDGGRRRVDSSEASRAQRRPRASCATARPEKPSFAPRSSRSYVGPRAGRSRRSMSRSAPAQVVELEAIAGAGRFRGVTACARCSSRSSTRWSPSGPESRRAGPLAAACAGRSARRGQRATWRAAISWANSSPSRRRST